MISSDSNGTNGGEDGDSDHHVGAICFPNILEMECSNATLVFPRV